MKGFGEGCSPGCTWCDCSLSRFSLSSAAQVLLTQPYRSCSSGELLSCTVPGVLFIFFPSVSCSLSWGTFRGPASHGKLKELSPSAVRQWGWWEVEESAYQDLNELKVESESPFPKLGECRCQGGGKDFPEGLFSEVGRNSEVMCALSKSKAALHLWVFWVVTVREVKGERAEQRRSFSKVGVGCWTSGPGSSSACSDFFIPSFFADDYWRAL